MSSIKGLLGFLRDVKNLSDERLHGTKLVIDALAFSKHIVKTYSVQPQYHGSYIFLASKFEEYFLAFKKCDIRPLLVVKGGRAPQRNETINESQLQQFWKMEIQGLMNLKMACKKGTDADDITHEQFFQGLQKILFDIAEKHNAPVLHCHKDVPSSAVVALAAYLDCPVVTNSTVALLTAHTFKLGNNFRFILLNEFKPKAVDAGKSFSCIECQSFSPSNSVLKNIKSSLLPILAAMLRCDPAEKKGNLPKSVEDEMRAATSRKPMPRGRGRGGRMAAPPRAEKPMTVKFRACIKFIESTGDVQALLGQLVICQATEERNSFVKSLHNLFLELYPASYELGHGLATVLGMQSPFPPTHFTKGNLFVSSNDDKSSNFKSEIIKLLTGSQHFPNTCDPIGYLGEPNPLISCRNNDRRLASALYATRGRMLNLRLEDYGTLASVNHVAVRLRQLVYGILLNLDRSDLSKVPGFDPETQTVLEFINEMGKSLSCRLRIESITLNDNSSLMSLLRGNGDVNFNTSSIDSCQPPWIAGISLLAAYWTLHTSVKEDKHLFRMAFIITACFNCFYTEGCEKLELKPDEILQRKLLDFYDEYASQLKSGSKEKTLSLPAMHAFSEMLYLEPYMRTLNEMMPNKRNRIQMLCSWKYFPHGRLFHWIASHKNMKTNHIQNMGMFANSPTVSKRITELVFNAMKVCDELLGLNKDNKPFSPVSPDCYIKMSPLGN